MKAVTRFGERLEEKLKDKKFAKFYYQEIQRLRLAHQILEIREKKGLSQAELAKKIGTTQSGVARLEDARYTGYSLRSLLKIALALDADLDVRLKPRRA